MIKRWIDRAVARQMDGVLEELTENLRDQMLEWQSNANKKLDEVTKQYESDYSDYHKESVNRTIKHAEQVEKFLDLITKALSR